MSLWGWGCCTTEPEDFTPAAALGGLSGVPGLQTTDRGGAKDMPKEAGARLELETLKMGALSKRAVECGAQEGDVHAAQDSDTPKEALVELILVHSAMGVRPVSDENSALANLRAELETLKMGALSKRAVQCGAEEDDVHAAQDSESPKEALVELILGRTHSGAVEDSAIAVLRAELESLKLSELSRRAMECAEREEVHVAQDSDSPKDRLVDLILAHSAMGSDGERASAALRAELETLKMSALSKRAVECGAEEEEVHAAQDSDSPKDALVELILAQGPNKRESQVTVDLPDESRPHFGVRQEPEGAHKLLGALVCAEQQRWAMFSYQW